MNREGIIAKQTPLMQRLIRQGEYLISRCGLLLSKTQIEKAIVLKEKCRVARNKRKGGKV